MKERGILFQAPLVRALLAGTKSQTRRLMKPQPTPIPEHVTRVSPHDDSGFWWASDKCRSMVDLGTAAHLSPYGSKGDRLWVRETFALSIHDPETLEPDVKNEHDWDPPVYRADGEEQGGGWTRRDENGRDVPTKPPWRPSIFMPRWASRITLEVTEVRVQRLQEISEEEARAEGVTTAPQEGLLNGKPATLHPMTHRQAFIWLWDQINGERASWSSNPWVWAVSFRRLP